MTDYFVCDGRGVSAPGGGVLSERQKLPEGFDRDWIKQLLAAGYVREGSPGPSPVDIYKGKPISHRVDDGTTAPPAGKPAVATTNVWNLTDEQLRGKSLEDMNAMIVERGGQPVASIEDAIQRLQAELR